ncbi:MAG: hypothetical protein JXX14_05600 [Deltaproteobacteria bacterium]|nr:hypothetical protein [Deltaproteobacteria bacterium]
MDNVCFEKGIFVGWQVITCPGINLSPRKDQKQAAINIWRLLEKNAVNFCRSHCTQSHFSRHNQTGCANHECNEERLRSSTKNLQLELHELCSYLEWNEYSVCPACALLETIPYLPALQHHWNPSTKYWYQLPPDYPMIDSPYEHWDYSYDWGNGSTFHEGRQVCIAVPEDTMVMCDVVYALEKLALYESDFFPLPPTEPDGERTVIRTNLHVAKEAVRYLRWQMKTIPSILPDYLFRNKPTGWEIRFNGKEIKLSNHELDGWNYIHFLLQHPNEKPMSGEYIWNKCNPNAFKTGTSDEVDSAEKSNSKESVYKEVGNSPTADQYSQYKSELDKLKKAQKEQKISNPILRSREKFLSDQIIDYRKRNHRDKAKKGKADTIRNTIRTAIDKLKSAKHNDIAQYLESSLVIKGERKFSYQHKIEQNWIVE